MKRIFKHISTNLKTAQAIHGRRTYAAILAIVVFLAVGISPSVHADATGSLANPQGVTTSSAGLAAKVAPGELLPISIKLSNFGGGGRIDVLVQYGIYASNGKKIYSADETVAVATTNNYVKALQIPPGTAAGTYTVKTSITYAGQVVPAESEFTFQVEPRILGLFRGEFIMYSGVTILTSALVVMIGVSLIKRRRTTRLAPLDYSNIPSEQRVFYELISDTVMSMRQKVGDKALEIAIHTQGLAIDKRTGRILKLSDSPSKVIADLVSNYERVLGKKTNFEFRRSDKSILKIDKG